MSEAEPPRVTALLARWRGGDATAANDLLPIVYHELQRIARCHMAGERRGHILQTTALVNEAYLRLVDARRVRSTASTHVRCRGTEGAIARFWRPDSRRIGFFTRGMLKTVSVDGGSPVTAD